MIAFIRFLRSRGKAMLVHASLLGAGIAVCVVAFAAADGILFQRLPYPEPHRLVWIGAVSRFDAAVGLGFSRYEALVDRGTALERVAPYTSGSMTLRTETGGAQRITAAKVGGEFFKVLGVQPRLGRALAPEDDRRGAERVVVLSDSISRRGVGAERATIGSLVFLDDRPHRVVGIMGSGAAFPVRGTDAWVPIEPTSGALLRSTNAPFLRGIGRLRQGANLQALRAQLQPLANPSGTDEGRLVIEALPDHLVSGVKTAIYLLFAASTFLMLIACLAAVTIQLAGSASLEREAAIRAAIGASVARLSRRALAEGLLNACAAAGVGLLVSLLSLHLVRASGRVILPELDAVRLSLPVFAATAVLALLSAVLISLVPMFSLLRSNPNTLMRRVTPAASAGRSTTRFRDGLIGASVGVSLVLVLGAVVAADAFVRLVRVETGFSSRELVSATVRLPFNYVTPAEAAQIRAFVDNLRRSLSERHPRASIAVSTDVPGGGNQSIVAVRDDRAQSASPLQVGMSQVSAEYFALLGIRLRLGRPFQTVDHDRSQRVAIVDADLARAVFGDTNVVGRIVHVLDLNSSVEIVGVVDNVRQGGRLREQLPQIYLPFEQLPLSTFSMTLLPKGPLAALNDDFASAVRQAHAGAASTRLLRLEELLYAEVQRPRFYALALSLFALVAIVVSAGAVNASVASLVVQRTHEIGIRMALGASAERIQALVLKRVSQMIALGSVAGTLVGYVAIRILESRIDFISRPSVFVFVSSCLVLWAAAALAVFLPVWRATRISPTLALAE